MKQFKKILFVNEQSNSSPAAAKRAVTLAKNNKAKLTLCDASKELSRTLPTLKTTLAKLHKEQVLAQFDSEELNAVDSSTKLLTGTPFIEIIREVHRGRHDLVIKLAEKSGSLFGGLFGETDLHLMRKCPTPVWIVKPTRQKTYNTIVAAVDPDPSIEAHAALNKEILELSIALAEQEKCELHIVHSWYLEGEQLLRGNRTAINPDEVDAMVDAAKRQHSDYMDELLANFDLDSIKVKVHLLKGLPGSQIPKIIKKLDADLVVMGTVARTGIEGLFIGNTAETILRNVDCSVLTVKPEGFKSPIG